ncbi:MAG: hypothetical protein EOP47_27645 [Sphingobacteriaceae bacterium]|nr:MAG: hypothetical protein EOP47_27645 [Sphingobacteriaceae bacterium]
MRKLLLILSSLFIVQSSTVLAGDLGINVIVAGELRPGVYGQVEIGNAPRPVVVYEQPRVVVVEKRYARAEPVYLHVPPGHAKNWKKHCHSYHACGRKVYFVRSAEYEPDYHSHSDHHDHSHNDHDHDGDHKRGNKHKHKGNH